MRSLLAFLATMMVAGLLVGCGGGKEIRGVTKPQPKIKSVSLNRQASVLTIDTNRVEFDITEMRVWRMTDIHGNPLDPGAQRRYLNFQYSHGSAQGDSGKAIFVLAAWSDEAIDFSSTYYALVEMRAEVYVRDQSRSRETNTTLSDLMNAVKAETPEFDLVRVITGVSEPTSRAQTETAYAAGLWQLNPNGSSIRLQ